LSLREKKEIYIKNENITTLSPPNKLNSSPLERKKTLDFKKSVLKKTKPSPGAYTGKKTGKK